jgi:hypothetical protein
LTSDQPLKYNNKRSSCVVIEEIKKNTEKYLINPKEKQEMSNWGQ